MRVTEGGVGVISPTEYNRQITTGGEQYIAPSTPSSSSGGNNTSNCPNEFTDPQGWLVCEMGNAFVSLVNNSPSVFQKVFGYVASPIQGALGDVSGTVSSGFGNITGAMSSLPSDIANQLSPYFNNILGGINNIASKMGDIPTAISSGFSNLGGYISGGISSGASAIGADITKALAPLTTVFENMFNFMKGAFTDLINGISGLGTDLGKIGASISTFVSNAVSFIQNFFANIQSTLISFLNTHIVDPLTGFYQNTILPAVNYVKSNYLDPFINDLHTLVNDFSSFVGVAGTVGADILTGVKDVSSASVATYKFLANKVFLLPNWAWITIAGVGGIVGIASLALYSKGYITEMGMKEAMAGIKKHANILNIHKGVAS